MANMAVDSYMPHRFSQLSDRLTMSYGVLLIGGASLLALVYTGGNVTHPGGAVFDQRLSDVLALRAGDVPVLGAGAEEASRLAEAHLRASDRPHTLRLHPYRDGLREVRGRGMGDARADRRIDRGLFPDSPALSQGPRQAPAARWDSHGSAGWRRTAAGPVARSRRAHCRAAGRRI